MRVIISRFINWMLDTKWKQAHPLLLSDWHHAVMTYDGNIGYPFPKETKFYVDGMLPEYHDQYDLKLAFPEGLRPKIKYEPEGSFSISMWAKSNKI